MKFSNFIFSLVVAATLVSCKKDKENPTIFIESPENHKTYHSGDMIHANGTFSDDRGLKEYSIYVGDVNGEHNHAWHFMEQGSIDGDNFQWEGHLTVPDSMPEVLFLHFEVTDLENKTASDKIMMHFH